MLTGTNRRTVQIPHEPGEHLVLRGLSWKKLEEARELRSQAAIQSMREMGPELALGLQADSAPTEVQEQQRNPLNQYDWGVLLRSGIVGWSYEQEVTPGNIEDLDRATAEFAVAELLKPFEPQTEEDHKEAFLASSVS